MIPCLPTHGIVVETPENITEILLAWREGDESALEKLTPIVYAELHRVARRYMAQERSDHMLQPTALVHEAYLRLVDSSRVRWQNRAHFLAVAAQLMRRILVDFARNRRYQKRGGEWEHVTFDEMAVEGSEQNTDLVAIDDALQSLAHLDPRKAQVVELRFFGGLTLEETA